MFLKLEFIFPHNKAVTNLNVRAINFFVFIIIRLKLCRLKFLSIFISAITGNYLKSISSTMPINSSQQQELSFQHESYRHSSSFLKYHCKIIREMSRAKKERTFLFI